MFFHGNFALISPAGLLQILCQEQRSATIFAWRGASKATVQIYEGFIVAATCDDLTGPEAVYQIAAWDSGRFELTEIAEPPDTTMMAAGWEELLLEAARQRDETELTLQRLLPWLPSQQVDQILVECPALAGVALVGYDGRLLAMAGLTEQIGDQANKLAIGLAAIGSLFGENQGVALYVGNGHKLLLADWGNQALLLAVPAPGASISDASNQIAAQTTGDSLHSAATRIS